MAKIHYASYEKAPILWKKAIKEKAELLISVENKENLSEDEEQLKMKLFHRFCNAGILELEQGDAHIFDAIPEFWELLHKIAG